MVWTVIYSLITRTYSQLIDQLFVNPVFWFLIVLWIFDLFTVVRSVSKIKFADIILYLVCVLLCTRLWNSCMTIKFVVMFYPFYYLGVHFNRIVSFKVVSALNARKWISIILYPISMVFFSYENYPLYTGKVLSVIPSANPKLVNGFLHIYNHFVVAMLGITFSWVVAKFICQHSVKLKGFISYIAKYTMEIYILHQAFIVAIPGFNIILSSIISLILGVMIPVLITNIIKKSRTLSAVLLGSC